MFIGIAQYGDWGDAFRERIKTMKVVFAGTPYFARLAYEAIIAAGFEVPLVLTQPDRPAGRGMKLMPSPVKQAALEQHTPVAQPTSLRLDGKYPDEAQQAKALLEAIEPDVMVVAAYGLILPQWVLDLPRYGCLNIHASLLPRWRGAAPIQRAILAGDKQTGVCIMQMDIGLDTGDILLQDSLEIGDKNAQVLHDELADMGARLIVQALQNIEHLTAVPQPEQGVLYADKITKQEAKLDWYLSAHDFVRAVRAYNPMPGASVELNGQTLKIWQASVLDDHAQGADIGKVLSASAQGIDVQTAQGVVRLLELQQAGGKRQPVSVFINGWRAT